MQMIRVWEGKRNQNDCDIIWLWAGVSISFALHITDSMELSPSWEAAASRFPSFNGTRRFSTVFTRTVHWSHSWARSNPVHTTHHIRLGFPDDIFSSYFPTKIQHVFLFATMRAICPALVSLLDLVILIILAEEFSDIIYLVNMNTGLYWKSCTRIYIYTTTDHTSTWFNYIFKWIHILYLSNYSNINIQTQDQRTSQKL
jgi:hypothetical protein